MVNTEELQKPSAAFYIMGAEQSFQSKFSAGIFVSYRLAAAWCDA
jgi:hypothetical protein